MAPLPVHYERHEPDGTVNGLPFYNCVAISQTGDPTGAYYRYAFITAQPGTTSTFFPDYPEVRQYGRSRTCSLRVTSDRNEYGISVYALEKNKMVEWRVRTRAQSSSSSTETIPTILPLVVGDGLPASRPRRQHASPKRTLRSPIVGHAGR